jgi:hypothetical protein
MISFVTINALNIFSWYKHECNYFYINNSKKDQYHYDKNESNGLVNI